MKTKRRIKKIKKSRKLRKQKGGIEPDEITVLRDIIRHMSPENLQFRKIKEELSRRGINLSIIDWINFISGEKNIKFDKEERDLDDEIVIGVVNYFKNKSASGVQHGLDDAANRDKNSPTEVVKRILDAAYVSIKSIVGEERHLNFKVLMEIFENDNIKRDEHGNPLMDEHGKIKTRKLTPAQWALLLQKLSDEGKNIEFIPEEIRSLMTIPPAAEIRPRPPVERWRCDRCGFDNSLRANNCGMCNLPNPNAFWQCQFCTFENKGDSTKCEMCSKSRRELDNHGRG